jgi:hypothetical protein
MAEFVFLAACVWLGYREVLFAYGRNNPISIWLLSSSFRMVVCKVAVMFSHSSSTVRVKNIGINTGSESLEAFASLAYSPKKQRWRACFNLLPSRHQQATKTTISLAPHGGCQVGTITLPSKRIKDQLPRPFEQWEIDDEFAGLTPFYAPPDAQMEYVYPVVGTTYGH